VVAVIGLNALGAFASNGAQAFTWLVLSAVTFFLPYGLLVAELGSTFAQEGGIYEWCKLAGGRLYAAFAATLYWITIPLLMGGSAAVIMIAALKIFWFGNANFLFGGHVVTDVLIELALSLHLGHHLWRDHFAAPWQMDLHHWLLCQTGPAQHLPGNGRHFRGEWFPQRCACCCR
jgi:amino acid transporter